MNRVQWGAAHEVEKSCAEDTGDPQKNVWEREGLGFSLGRAPCGRRGEENGVGGETGGL